MTTSTSTNVLPMLLAEVEVVSVERLSPSFVRVELGSAELGDFGVDGERYDQRIKLVFPDPETGGITSVADADESWLATWLDQPTEERGHMRTYTIRDVRGSGVDTTIVVDIVLHLEGDQVGPGSNWAADAAPGDRLVMLAPRRGFPYGGIEFAPAAGADAADGGRRDRRTGRVHRPRAAPPDGDRRGLHGGPDGGRRARRTRPGRCLGHLAGAW